MEYIYSRVSTDRQDTQNQLSHLQSRYPNAQVHEETASGFKKRPILDALIPRLKKGDVLIVAALDRLGRKTLEILGLIEDLDKRGVILVSIREGLDYSTIAGRLVMQILVSIAEMERSLISERTKSALAAKRKQGIVGGRRPTYSQDVVSRVKELRRQGLTIQEINRLTSISTGRISELLRSA